MKIDKELLDQQLTGLEKQTEEFKTNLNATLGAIDMCQHFLKVLDMEEPKENRTSNEKEKKDAMAKGKKAGNKKATGGKKGPGREKAGKKAIQTDGSTAK